VEQKTPESVPAKMLLLALLATLLIVRPTGGFALCQKSG
jgi:hypothetical protein